MSKQKTEMRRLKAKPEYRSIEVNKDSINVDQRTIEISFSSEEPVDRWFGKEILDHSDGSIRMNRINTKAPFLDQHDSTRQIGVIEKAWIDGAARKGRALVRFGQSQIANEIFQDFVDGIRASISVGYRVIKAILEETGEEGTQDVYRVTEWEPFEISSVSIPADITVGIGRSAALDDNDFEIEERRTIMGLENKDDKQTPPTVDESAIRSKALDDERKRTSEIMDIAKDFGLEDEARSFIADGKSAEAFRVMALDKIKTRGAKPLDTEKPKGDDLGLSEKEKRAYSFMNLLRALATGKRSEAEFEMELSDAMQKKLSRSAKGAFVPIDVLTYQRDLDSSTGKGSEFISTNLLVSSFIDLLRNKMVARSLGATVLSGLVGNVSIPKATGGSNTYWVPKNGDVSESDNSVSGQVGLTPKTVGTFIDILRNLLNQSSIGVEMFVRDMIAKDIALAIDLACFHGTGADNQPTGIFNTSGIGSVAIDTNGGVPTLAKIIELESKVSALNADIGSLAYVTNAKGRGILKSTKVDAGSGIMVWQNSQTPGEGLVNGYRAVATNQIKSNLTKGTGTGLSGLLFGNFSDLVIGEWGVLDLNIDTSAKSLSGGLRVIALQDVDIAIKNAASFAAIIDMKTE